MENRVVSVLDEIKKRMVGLCVERVFGKEKIILSDTDVIVLCLVRDGEDFIDEFLRYYEKLGVRHIVLLDNGSGDGTLRIARKYFKEYGNVTLLKTDFPFRNLGEMRMRDWMIETFATNKWSLCVDIDEFFDYPYSDRLPLNKFIEYLNINEYTALTTYMLDMFPESHDLYGKDPFVRKNHKYYDLSDIRKDGSRYYGGIKKKLFGFDHSLFKHSLIKFGRDTWRGRAGHGLANGIVADFSSVLLHYRFTKSFLKYVKFCVEEEQHYGNSKKFKVYLQALEGKKVLKIKNENSQILENINQLIEDQFIHVSDSYLGWVDRNDS
jgi:glycosyltransferase involved in cell wall biosynthesis